MRLVKIFASQCLFQPLPQDWSISREESSRTIWFYLAVFWSIQLLLIGDAAEAFLATILELVLTLGFLFAVLSLTKRLCFFVPAATYLMGAEALLGLLAIPVIVWLRVAEDAELLIAFYSLVVLSLWGLVVLGHVFRQVLARPSSFGFGVACAYAVEAYLGTLFLLLL
jgi:hypothetical protein